MVVWSADQSASNNPYVLYFLHTVPTTIVFKLEYVLFYQFYAELSIFSIKTCSVSAPIYDVLMSCTR